MQVVNCCENCKNLWIYSPDWSSPHGEISCTEGHWDGVTNTDQLLEQIFCKDWEKKNVTD